MIWITSVILIVLGITIRVAAIRELRRHRAWSLSLQVPIRIVNTGPYGYIRHPSYLGSGLIIIGAALLSPVAGVILIAIAFFAARIVNEEQVLMLHPDYREYKKKTGCIIPRIRRAKNGNSNTV